MNKKLLLGTASLGLLLVLSGCGTNNSASTATNNSVNKGATNRRPDYGQPTTTPEIRGLVKSVVGNEVTVLKIDRPQGTGRDVATSTNTTDTKIPTLSLSGSTGGGGNRGGQGGGMGFNGGGRPQGGGQGGSNTTTDSTAMLDRIKAMSTGEEKVIIPVGIKMLKADPNSTGKQRTMVEAMITDITADKMLTIWLDASVTDKKVASFVMIN